MRPIIGGLLIASLAMFGACSGFAREEVKFKFDNRTDVPVCYYLYADDVEKAECNQEIKPHETKSWRPRCAYGSNADKAQVTVILTVAEAGRRIYDQTLRCRAWQNTDGTFVIEKLGAAFYVADPITRQPKR
jgi:hypothetical protein